MDAKEIKQRHFNKVYKNAVFVECACGCGKLIKNKDRYGRDKKYISGHNTPKKYDDPTQFKREWNHRNRESRNEYKIRYIQARKVDLIKQKGSTCKICGYQYDGTNACCFDLHHRDGKDKSFNLNLQSLNNKSLAEIQAEAEKCDLLCALCHRKIHSKAA